MRRIVYRMVTSILIAVFVAIPVVAQDLARTPSRQPDLQGVLDFRTITLMERPEELADKRFLTAEEAAEIENIRAFQDAGRREWSS